MFIFRKSVLTECFPETSNRITKNFTEHGTSPHLVNLLNPGFQSNKLSGSTNTVTGAVNNQSTLVTTVRQRQPPPPNLPRFSSGVNNNSKNSVGTPGYFKNNFFF